MIKLIYELLSIFLIMVFIGCGTKRDIHAKSEEGYHLYLLVGQSNMAGRGVIGEIDTTIHPRVFALNINDEFIPAKEPLHFDKSNRGVGPGFEFGKVMASANSKAKIGLIPAAVGGTKISYWEPHSPKGLYEEAIRKTRIAMEYGKLKGIIWQQGESDSNIKDAPLYKERLIKLLTTFRNDLGDDTLPIVIGGLGDFLKSERFKDINKALQEAANQIGNASFSEASKQGHIGDRLHFNSSAQRENGRNMAAAMSKLISNID